MFVDYGLCTMDSYYWRPPKYLRISAISARQKQLCTLNYALMFVDYGLCTMDS